MVEKSNTEVALEYFFTFPTEEIHLRELSRKLKLSMPAILRAVKLLEKENLLVVKRGKVLTSVKANIENIQFIRLKKVSNLKNLYTSSLVDFLEKSFHPEAIICFGSYSRGEDTENSDIDIAVISGKKKNIEIKQFEELLNRSISVHHIDLDKVSKEFRFNIYNGIVLEGAL